MEGLHTGPEHGGNGRYFEAYYESKASGDLLLRDITRHTNEIAKRFPSDRFDAAEEKHRATGVDTMSALVKECHLREVI